MRALPLLACSLFLGGCLFSRPASLPEAPVPEARELSPAAKFIAENGPGAAAAVFDPDFGGHARVSVEEQFASASGKICRRAAVSSPSGETELVIFCRDGDAWEMMPRIWGGKAE